MPIGPRGEFSNQAGNVRPDLGGGFSSFQNRMMSMGCNGLISRRDVLQTKLNRFGFPKDIHKNESNKRK